MENKPSMLKSAMNYGAILGLALVLFSILIYFLNLIMAKWVGFATMAIIIGGIIFATKKHRDENLGGYITYGQAIGFSVLTVLFASVILGFFNFILYKFIDPSLINLIINTAEENILKSNPNIPEDQLEIAMSITRKFTRPELMFLSTIVGNTILGAIFSLITSIFLKKEDSNFESNFK